MSRSNLLLFVVVGVVALSVGKSLAQHVDGEDDHDHGGDEHLLPHGHWFVDKIFLRFSNETLHYSLLSKEGSLGCSTNTI